MLIDLLESIKLSSLNSYNIIKTIIKVVDETNNITYDNNLLLLCCLSFHAIHF